MNDGGTTDSLIVERAFFGRTHELAELRAGLAGSIDGHGRMFLISGEPGIGKSRLAEEIGADARGRGVRVAWGRCSEDGGAPAYWPLIQVIRACVHALEPDQRRAFIESEIAPHIVQEVSQIVPELRSVRGQIIPRPGSFDPESARFRLYDAVSSLLKNFARATPILILIDDLHDADQASLMLLRFLAREVRDASIMVVATCRDVEVRRSPALSKMIGELSRDATSIPLTGLSEAEVARFIERSSGQTPDASLVSRLHAETDGNPLFVEGVIRILISERAAGHAVSPDRPFRIPEGVRQAIRQQMAGLSDQTKMLLEVAATIGNEFETGLCERVASIFQTDLHRLLDQAVAAGILIRIANNRFRFGHALVRATVYEALDTETRFRLHGEIAEAMEEIRANDLPPYFAELAHHFREAGMRQRAIDYSIRAADAAYAVFANSDAATLYREALALCQADNERKASILQTLGNVTCFALDRDEGIGHFEAALRLYKELGNERKVAEVNASLGLAFAPFSPGMNIPRALGHFREAQAWTGEWTDLYRRGWLHRGTSMALFEALRIDEALTASERAIEIFKQGSKPDWIPAAAFCAQLLMVKGRLREATTLLDEVSRVVHEIADPELFRSALWSAGWYRLLMRDLNEARRMFTLGMERTGLSPQQRAVHFEFLALTELLAGDVSRAKALVAEHRVNLNFQSRIALREGDWEAAIEMQLAMLEWAQKVGSRWSEVDVLASLFESLTITGDQERANEIFRQARGIYDPSHPFYEMCLRPRAALQAIEKGQPAEATQHLEVCRAIMAQGEDWLGRVGMCERAEGALAGAQGRNCNPRFEKSIAIHRRYNQPWETAETFYYWGYALNCAGDHSLANEKLDAAIEIYRRHGAGQRWIDRVEAVRKSKRSAQSSTLDVAPRPATFRRDGEYWTLAFQNQTFRLRDSKGLGYIALLIRNQGRELRSDEVASRGAFPGNGKSAPAQSAAEIIGDLGDSGPILDAQAKSEYRTRLRDLRAELEDAVANNDLGRADSARVEIDALEQQLAAALGLGGRDRMASSHLERARWTVTNSIKRAIAKIHLQSPALERHLNARIRTGNFCSYSQDPERPVEWQL